MKIDIQSFTPLYPPDLRGFFELFESSSFEVKLIKQNTLDNSKMATPFCNNASTLLALPLVHKKVMSKEVETANSPEAKSIGPSRFRSF